MVEPTSPEYLAVMDAASVYAWGFTNPDRIAAKGERVALGRRLRELRRRVIAEGVPLKDRRQALFACAEADHGIAVASAALDRARVVIAEGTIAGVTRLKTAARAGLIEVSGLAPSSRVREIIPALQWQDLEIDVLGVGGKACVRRPGVARPAWLALLVERMSVVALAYGDKQPWIMRLNPPRPMPMVKPIKAIGGGLGPPRRARDAVEPISTPLVEVAEPIAATDDPPPAPKSKQGPSRAALDEWVRKTVAENQHRARYSARAMERDARTHFPGCPINRTWIEKARAGCAPERWHKIGPAPHSEE